MDTREKIRILTEARKQLRFCYKTMRVHSKSSLGTLFKVCILKELDAYIDSDLYNYTNNVQNAEMVFTDEGLKELPNLGKRIINYDYDAKVGIALAKSISEHIVPLNVNGMINGGVS